MSATTNRTLSEFQTDGGKSPDESETDVWPVHVAGHRVTRTTPQNRVTGSGDKTLAFECESCGEHVIPPKDRSVDDHEWAENRFRYVPCSPGDNRATGVSG